VFGQRKDHLISDDLHLSFHSEDAGFFDYVIC